MKEETRLDRKDGLHCPNCDSLWGPYVKFVDDRLVVDCEHCEQMYDLEDLAALCKRRAPR